MAHWSETKERGAGFLQMQFMLWLYRRIGLRRLRRIVHPVVFCIWAFSSQARRVSANYLSLVARRRGEAAPGWRQTYFHFYSFTCCLLEKVAAWSGEIDLADLRLQTPGVQELIDDLRQGHGVVVLCSHLGNVEMLRALASLQVGSGQSIPNFAINSVVEFGGSAHFNRMLAKANPDSMLRLIPAGNR